MKQPSYAWINPQDFAQLEWIMGYLSRHQPDFVVPVAPYSRHSLPDANALIEALEARMGVPLFRERYRKMQAAWRKAKSRQHPDRRVATYQLSTEVLNLLERLARKRRETKINVLEASIRDGWYEHDRVAKEVKKVRNDYKARLKDQRSKYLEAEKVRWGIISGLLDALSESLNQLSSMEAQVGEYDNEPLDDDAQAHRQTLLDEKVAHVNASIPYLRTQRPPGGSLQQRIDKLTSVS